MDYDETACPDCAETIKAAAKVCKHCGYRHPVEPSAPTLGQPTTVTTPLPAPPLPLGQDPKGDWWQRTFDHPGAAKVGCLGMFGAIIMGVFLILSASGDHRSLQRSKASPPVTSEAPPSDDTRAIDVMVEAKENVKTKLREPGSAQFRALTVFKNSGKLWALCGQVNSKNGFGGYTGFKGFVAFAHPEAPTVIDGEPSGLGADIDRDLYREARKTFCIRPVGRF